ncbi:hypothetical protein [Sphingosinicella sp.]|jgi:hypothetical protein|uniref:hypothetical protein n=1 Tax=Sphingosinicella sp. TaxID=1917971 RepID=UPI00184198C0|nr:hypothetical protein [Sphingosinicella sp.]MBA4759273.1 hypothetical protein [Sphingosinicella sp.]MEA3538945.1 hypothetical protein [Pseudomonadota bacterium]
MHVFEMVVLVVAISVFGKIILQYMKQKGRERPDAELENDRLRGEIGNLKDRIATLERLATDRSRLLADEIDALGRDR